MTSVAAACVEKARVREELEWAFGRGSVVDVCSGTALEELDEEFGFGLYIVPGAVPEESVGRWEQDVDRMFSRLGRSSRVRVSGGPYRTAQAVVGACVCKYNYAGTRKHPVEQLRDLLSGCAGRTKGSAGVPIRDDVDCEVLSEALDWVDKSCGDHQFNELVANQYLASDNEKTPWHSDSDALILPHPTIMSVSLQSPGAFCFAPGYDGLLPGE